MQIFNWVKRKALRASLLTTTSLFIGTYICAEEPTVTYPVDSISENVALDVKGNLPSWLSGTLVRNGPVNITVNGETNKHLFDGLSMLLSFSFENEKITYSNQFLKTDAYNSVFKEGSLNYEGFATDPCRSVFKDILSYFFSSSEMPLHNTNVNVAKLSNEYVALTEYPLPVQFDPKTLETLGVFDYEDELPKSKCWESAHPHYLDGQDTAMNYLIQFGYNSYYTFYTIDSSSKERHLIAKVPVDNPAYMHSFALTENYIILTEFPFLVTPLDLITKGKAFIKNFTWQPEKGTKFVVINRQNGSVEKELHTRPFFAFHHANAFEEDQKLHIDVVAYDDPSIITSSHLQESDEDGPIKHFPRKLERFSFSLNSDEVTSEVLLDKTVELPRINEARDGKPYSYVYTVGFLPDSNEYKGKSISSDYLYKCNVKTKTHLQWSEKHCSPGEPVFIPSPHAVDEDDGAVLSIVLNEEENSSFLLVLDAKSFNEIARAKMPCSIPTGLHGQFFQ
ncbi:MAG: Apocarotenoid-15,15'-oxygenase [Chlamydiia bacterium]|nr:Apocarotenoid-15,15'-oxygenase [Chlamydiia bacterium]